MINELFYQAEIPETGRFFFDEEEAHHAIRTRRHLPGANLHLTDGKGSLVSCRLLGKEVKKCELEVLSKERIAPLHPGIHLAVSPLKQEARLEWIIEKAVEIGVSSITLLQCQRTEKSFPKLPRLERLMVAAMKQSLKCHLPRLTGPIALDAYLQQASGRVLLAHCAAGEKQVIAKSLLLEENHLLIGPEGDFSSDEIAWAAQKGVYFVTLGNERLRTETAALVGLAEIKHALR